MQKFVWFPFHPTIAPLESPVSKSPDGFKQIIQNISNSSQTVYTAVVTNFGLSTFPKTPDFFAILSFSKLTKITWFLPYKTSRFALPGWGVMPRTWSFVIFASWICKRNKLKSSKLVLLFQEATFHPRKCSKLVEHDHCCRQSQTNVRPDLLVKTPAQQLVYLFFRINNILFLLSF